MLTVLISIFNLLGTPEVGGLTTIQSLEIIQGCKGMNIIGGDLVEVCCLKRKVEMVITICYSWNLVIPDGHVLILVLFFHYRSTHCMIHTVPLLLWGPIYYLKCCVFCLALNTIENKEVLETFLGPCLVT